MASYVVIQCRRIESRAISPPLLHAERNATDPQFGWYLIGAYGMNGCARASCAIDSEPILNLARDVLGMMMAPHPTALMSLNVKWSATRSLGEADAMNALPLASYTVDAAMEMRNASGRKFLRSSRG